MTQFKEASPAAVKANVRQWRKEHQLDKPAPKPRPAIKIPAPTNKIKLSENKITLSFNSTSGELEVES